MRATLKEEEEIDSTGARKNEAGRNTACTCWSAAVVSAELYVSSESTSPIKGRRYTRVSYLEIMISVNEKIDEDVAHDLCSNQVQR